MLHHIEPHIFNNAFIENASENEDDYIPHIIYSRSTDCIVFYWMNMSETILILNSGNICFCEPCPTGNQPISEL